MKRASITFSDEIQHKLEHYLNQQAAPPSLSSLVQLALDEYLDKQAWIQRGHQEAQSNLALPVSDADVESDVSLKHDQYL